MTPFISSRVRKLDVGISGYTDTDSVLNVTGKVSVGTAIDLVPYDSINNGTLRLEGSAGTLFSISNNLTSGSIFSVNDATGVPSLDVNANGTILLAPFGQTEYIGIGKVNPTEKVDVEGSIKLSGNLLFSSFNVIEYSAAEVGVETLSFEGSAGQLFSVTNNLTTGSVFSVNTVSGLPHINVDANGTISSNVYGGNFGIGLELPTEKLEVNGNVKSVNVTATGDITASGDITAVNFNSTSDLRYKTNVKEIESPIEKIMNIRGVSFDWIETNKSSYGVIADEIQKVIPELVSGDNPKTVNYNGLIGFLIECVKNQQVEIEKLKES